MKMPDLKTINPPDKDYSIPTNQGPMARVKDDSLSKDYFGNALAVALLKAQYAQRGIQSKRREFK